MGDSTTSVHITGMEIAIVGMSGRFPGAENISQYWRNLCDGAESISFFSDEELLASGVERDALSKNNYVRAGALLKEPDYFDASFFGYGAREAEIMDPQHRIFLECAYEALEDAGYDPESKGSRLGVYAGASMNTYLFNLASNPRLVESLGPLQILIGNDKDHLATRVSYKLNLRGPAVVVQTACSTSLVAVHMACRALLSGECDMALAGGVSVNQFRKAGYYHQEGGIFSPDGHCRAFDAAAAGTIPGNGVGIVVLKRLEDALADRDCIQAVIKGSAISNDGSMKIGYTAPGVDGQVQAIKEALLMAEIDPSTITYVETHGTGTSVGDPIEIEALTHAYRESTDKKSFCAIGSVKTNIGHLDAAAGVAGLIKTVLSLKHKTIPPSLHFREANPKIDFANSPFYVNDRLVEWEARGSVRRAGVSAFGLGGTNAHVIVEEAPTVEGASPSRSRELILLSAKTRSALEAVTSRLCAHLKAHPDANLSDLAYTLKVGRKTFEHRRALNCSGPEDAIAALESMDPRRVLTGSKDPASRAIVFMFPGQGTQYVRMSAGLYREEPVFRSYVDLCSEQLRHHIGLDLRDVLYAPERESDERAAQLQQTSIAQPALFVIEYALAKLWIEWGVSPQAMIGHSIGEYVAACLSGVFSLDEGLALVAARGKLMQELPEGAMLAVPLDVSDMHSLLDHELSIAAINGPSWCVVSGPIQQVDSLAGGLRNRGIDAKRLHTSHAFHSSMMDPILKSFRDKVARVELTAPAIPYISNVTGDWIKDEEATDPGYWTSHLRQTVRYADGMTTLMKESDCVLLEVGPGRTLIGLAKLHRDQLAKQIMISSLPAWNDTQSDEACMLDALGKLWLSGARIDWDGFYAGQPRYRTPLPTYPFERRRYWIEALQRPSTEAFAAEESASTEQGEQGDCAPGGNDSAAPAYPRPDLQSVYAAPSSETERKVVRIWQEFVGAMEIGVDDNFYELGGHSLMAMQMASRLREEFQIELPLEDVFAAPSVASLAATIERILAPQDASAALADAITKRPEAEAYPLSFAQLRLWFLDQMSPGSSLYNIPAAISLKGKLEIAALEQSLDEIVRRHEALRTVFTTSKAEPVQLINPFTASPPPLVDLSGFNDATRASEAGRLAMEEAGRPFDLTRGPLMRASLLRLSEEEHVLLLTTHHIVSDAYSLGVLTRELTALYKAFSAGEISPLTPLPIQYADFAAWQREWLQGEVLETQVSYWKNQLAGSPALLELPTDRPRPQAQSFNGAAFSFELPSALTESLRSLSRRERSTLFMTLLAAFNLLLHRYSGQEDIVVGADIANRNRRELKDLIGFFVNMLVVRTDLSGNPTFIELLDRVRKVTSESYAYQDLPFDKVVERLQPERKPGLSPFFQVVFNYYLSFTDGLDLPGLTITDLNLDHEISRFDLSLFISDGAEKVSGCWRYSTALFDAATVEQMHRRFEALLHRVAEQPEARLSALDILTEAEKRERNETQKQLKKSNFDKFKKTRPKAIDESQLQLVRVERLPGAEELPLVIQPDMEDVDLPLWARSNLPYIEARLLKHGAILFRNFRVDSTEGFEQFVRAVDPRLLDYTEPSSPRSAVSDKIYTSTEYPASQWIQMHNEMSYSRQWPHRLFFFCVRPAEEGGATPLAFSRKIFELLDPKIRERFIEKKVMYIRNFGDGLDLTWQHVFNTDDRLEVERYCREASIEFEWSDTGLLKTRQVHQAVLRHPQTRDMVWFNQAHAFHSASLDPSVREALLAEKSEEEFPRNACYGDGSRIEDSVIEEIRQAYKTASVAFDWQAGDILMIENMLVAHGRAPFAGPRRILVAMSGLISGNDVESTAAHN